MTPQPTFPSLIDENARRQFEAAWRSGQPQPIEAFLPAEDAPRYLATLEELVAIELELRWKAGRERPRDTVSAVAPSLGIEAYLVRFPRLNRPDIVQRLLAEEQQVRQRHPIEPSSSGTVPQLSPSPVPVPLATLGGDRAESPPNLQVPGYLLLGVLGQGGMGVVYKAQQVQLGRLVALKMILSGSHAGRQDRERFRTEAESIARLQHPNIVQVYEVGEHEGTPFFSLEFCSGGSLDKKLQGTPLPPQEAALGSYPTKPPNPPREGLRGCFLRARYGDDVNETARRQAGNKEGPCGNS